MLSIILGILDIVLKDVSPLGRVYWVLFDAQINDIDKDGTVNQRESHWNIKPTSVEHLTNFNHPPDIFGLDS